MQPGGGAAAREQARGSCRGSWELGPDSRAVVSPGPGTDHLPALADHDADPGGGTATVCRAPLPHGRGEAASPASVREEGEPQARAAVSQDVERVPPCSLAPSLGFTGLCAPAAVCGFAHQPWSHLSVSASLHVGSSLLPASERSAQNPAPVELLGVQPSPADSHVGLPGAAQGAGVALGGEWGAGTPQLATCSHRSQ